MPTSPNSSQPGGSPLAGSRVAFLGPLGTFSYEAALAHFGGSVEFVAAPSIPAVFEAVVRGDAEQAVVPIENSIEGGVNFTQDTLLDTSLSLCGEIMLDVEQCLLSNAVDRSRIERVYSHPQGLAQCRKWLARHLPDAALVPTASTVQAAHLVAGDPSAACTVEAVGTSAAFGKCRASHLRHCARPCGCE